MTHSIYALQQLQELKLAEIKAIASQLGIAPEGDKRNKDIWVSAIIEHQKSQVVKSESLSGGIRQIDEQDSAQAELEAHIEAQADGIAPEDLRLVMNQRGYQDAVAGLDAQSSDPCYRVGYDRGFRDISPILAEDVSSVAIVFEKVADGRWQSTVNGVLVRIAAVKDGYKTNLTSDMVLVDYGLAIKESLLAVARLQAQPEKPALEVFATAHPSVYAVYSRKPGLDLKRYEVDLESESCTCPHYEHRHEQEGFRDKHIEAVKAAVRLRATPLPMEEEMLLDKPFDELTAQDWERIREPELELVAA